MSSIVYNSIKSETSFGKVHAVIKNSNIENYMQIVSNEDILKENLSYSVKGNIKHKKEFYELLTYLFQSLTNIGYTTYEIIEFICNTINSQGTFTESEQKEIINFLKNSFCFIHSDYSRTPLWKNKKNRKILNKILFGHDNIDNFNIGLVLGETPAKIIKKFPEFKKDLKTLSSFSGVKKSGMDGLNQYKELKKSFYYRNLNQIITDPIKTDTSVSSILISNPDIRIGTQNSLEISTFFNGIPTLELNRSYPYLNATFILPSVSRQELKSYKEKGNQRSFSVNATSSTINSFLFGDIKNRSKNYNNFSGDKISGDVVRTNMSLFTSPQTLVNLDEKIGHDQNNPGSNRKTSVHDPTQPLMTIKNINLTSSATKGLMSYKSGKLSLILHDRTRMNDIAPFVKPDLLGEFGAEIVLEYGWSNPDEDNPKNPLGYFLGNSKITEKYMIVNSSMSIDNSGQVNIDLSIAMKGPHQFKNQEISAKVKNRIIQNEFEESVGDINYNLSRIHSSDYSYLDSFNLNTKSFKGLLNESERLSDDELEKLIKFRNPHVILLNEINNNLSKYINITIEGVDLFVTIQKLSEKSKSVFSSLLASKREDIKSDESGNIKVKINNKTILAEDLLEVIKEILDNLNRLCQYISEIVKQDRQEGENERKILESIMGSIDYIDFFYPTSKKLYPKKNPQNYVSLGSIINTIVQHYIAKPKGRKESQFDEIQTIFYTANENSGKMSNESISSFLIDKKLLIEFLKSIFENKKIITPESLISQIIIKFIQVPDNVSYGLSSLYESREGNLKNPVRPKQSLVDFNRFGKTRTETLRKIYGLKNNFPSEEIKFNIPVIHMNFDCLTTSSITSNKKERSILRISIFDRTDSPFSSSSSILENIYTGNINKNIGKFLNDRRDFINNSRDYKKNNRRPEERENLKNFNIKQKNELNRLEKKKWIKKNKDGSYSINPEKINNKQNFIGGIKDVYKEIYPSLTFGTQNSIILNANVSTINDNKLSTIFMTRPDRNDQSLINNRVSSELPLVIMPTQASVEIIGCPWINFGQSVFLDFETGTTLDNKYVVTGITHNLSPGTYTTQLTLSYGDNYGQLKNFEDEINKNNLMSRRKDKRNFPNTKKPGKIGKKINHTINADEDYTKDRYYDKGLEARYNSFQNQ